MSQNVKVTLKCTREGSRLRVRIISSGYNNTANCQFPKNLRRDGQIYKVWASNISVGAGPAGKFFYRVNKNNIDLIEPDAPIEVEKVFESTDCCICLGEEPSRVLVPCGHLCLCEDCSDKIYPNDKCPLCRQVIQHIIPSSDLI